MRIWTIGHSTRTLEALLAALRAHQIEILADVRSFPTSQRWPQFDRANLETALPEVGIRYVWLKALGGYRKKACADSPHTALRSRGFRNYADHLETEEFRLGIRELLAQAATQRVAYMCAERLWWRCHRSLISDYLTALCGVEVVHILDENKTESHRLHRAARITEGRLIYDLGETNRLI
jgi:uncharacterized protein (DUF488 family)